MSCGGGHLGFPTSIKNRKFVEDPPMIIPGPIKIYLHQVRSISKYKMYLEGVFGVNIPKGIIRIAKIG